MNQVIPLRRTVLTAVAASALGILFASSVQAADPHYGEVVVSDSKGGDEKAVFAPTTLKIYVTAEIADLTKGTKLTGKWIAEKTQVASPDYVIDTADLTPTPMMNVATFSLSKPNQGWPEGDYRVELLINDKLAETAHFKVAP
jgi:hypothetical protein